MEVWSVEPKLDGLAISARYRDGRLVQLVTRGDGAAGEASDAGDSAPPLTGMSVVVTGAMTGPLAELSRNEVNELIERAGGKASSSVSARTSLLVAGEKAGSKRAKAEKLDITILTPEEFATRVAAFLQPGSRPHRR